MQTYDYGPHLNTVRYGFSTVPQYQMSRVKVPVAVMYGQGDTVTVPEVRILLFLYLCKFFNVVKLYITTWNKKNTVLSSGRFPVCVQAPQFDSKA